MREYTELDVSQEGDVLRIALDRPSELNTVTETVHTELSKVFRDANHSEARVIVLTGNGDTFSAGGDIEWIHDSLDRPEYFQNALLEGDEIIKSIVNLSKPIVARVNGDAIGLGATLALFCDIIVASEDAKIGDPHVNVGLVAGDGGAVIWPLLTSMSTAKEYLMRGKLIEASEAEEMGLVNHAVSDEQLDETVDEIVDDLATGPQAAIQYTKMALNEWLEMGCTLALRESLALEGLSQARADHEEAVDAYLDKRQPDFPSGRSSQD